MDEDPNPAKKIKVKHEHDHVELVEISDNPAALQTIPNQKVHKPFAVLANKYTRSLETALVYVADLVNPKLASKCIRELKEIYPLEDLQHLKRVRRVSHKDKGNILQVLITKVVNNDTDEQTSKNTHGLDKELSEPYTIEVPKYLPLTRKQFDEASKLWPSSFHEDKYIAKMISGEIFSEDDVKQINSYMSLAIQAAMKGKAKGMVGIGAVIVDPNNGDVLAIAHDLCCKGHVLQHATMVAIDLIAQRQSGGAWNLGHQQDDGIWVLRDSDSRLCDMDSNLAVLHKNETDVLCDNISNTSRLCDSSRLCDKYTGGLCDSDTNTGVLLDSVLHGSDTGRLHDKVTGGLCDNPGRLHDMCDNKHQASTIKTSQEKKDKTGPYLCTGYDLYVTREPCIMCAMSLVHSRIRRVFYGSKDAKIGALGSKYNLHVQDGLNHHYEVFCNVLQDECDRLMTLSS